MKEQAEMQEVQPVKHLNTENDAINFLRQVWILILEYIPRFGANGQISSLQKDFLRCFSIRQNERLPNSYFICNFSILY